MPVIRDSLDPKNPNPIALYRKSEIAAGIHRYKHLHIHDIKNSKMWYIAGKVRCENEAIVLIALMMRESNTKPAQFFFDSRINMVFASCEFSGSPHNVVMEKFAKIMDKVLGHPSLRYLKKDLSGDPIFLEHAAESMVADSTVNSAPRPTAVLHPDGCFLEPPKSPRGQHIAGSPDTFKFSQHFPFGDGNLAFDVHDAKTTE